MAYIDSRVDLQPRTLVAVPALLAILLDVVVGFGQRLLAGIAPGQGRRGCFTEYMKRR